MTDPAALGKLLNFSLCLTLLISKMGMVISTYSRVGVISQGEEVQKASARQGM